MDDQYLDEAERVQQHEERLAEIEANAKVKLAETRSRAASERRPYLLGAVAIVAGLIVVLAITAAIVWNVRSDRVQKEREQQRQADIAKVCIQAGNIWTNGQCLLTRRS